MPAGVARLAAWCEHQKPSRLRGRRERPVANIHLTLACGDYDRTRALIDGAVPTPGIDLTVIPLSDAWARHQRMVLHEEFDVCELSLSSFLMSRDRGRAFVAIPVFPYRTFRHSYLWCARAAKIERASDLAGKRVGVGMYQITTALWLRGHLEHDFGVPPSAIRWVTEMLELVPFDPPAGVHIDLATGGWGVEAMLLEGELDAYVGVEGIPPGFAGDPRVRRLFGRKDELAYFRRSGIFPIMHVVVFRAAVLEANPWAAVAMMDAFRQAKNLGRASSRYPRVSSLAWHLSYQEEELEIFGPDPYPYDFASNRRTIETAIQYAHEQGLIRTAPAPEDLFAPSTIDFPERGPEYGGRLRRE